MKDEKIPELKTEISIIPPIPPIKIGVGFDDGRPEFYNTETLLYFLSEHFQEELPSHINFLMEFPKGLIEASNQKIEKEERKKNYFFCIICGELKTVPLLKCMKCSYEPKTLEDMAILYTTLCLNPYLRKESTNSERLILIKKIEQDEIFLKKVAFTIFKRVEDILIDF